MRLRGFRLLALLQSPARSKAPPSTRTLPRPKKRRHWHARRAVRLRPSSPTSPEAKPVGGLAGVGLTAVERESLENVPGNFSDDVGIIDHETGLHGEPTGFLVVDRLPQVDRGIAAIRRKPEGEINFALPAGARQPLGLAANRISPPSLLIARRMRAEAANRQVK